MGLQLANKSQNTLLSSGLITWNSDVTTYEPLLRFFFVFLSILILVENLWNSDLDTNCVVM